MLAHKMKLVGQAVKFFDNPFELVKIRAMFYLEVIPKVFMVFMRLAQSLNL